MLFRLITAVVLGITLTLVPPLGAGKLFSVQKKTVMDLTLREKPLTVRIASEKGDWINIQKHIDSDPEFVVRVTVEGLKPVSAKGVKSVRFFLNKSDATFQTATTDPHYAGSLALTGGVPPKGVNYTVNITSAVKALREAKALPPGGSWELTLVPVPSDESNPFPDEVLIRLRKVSLSLGKGATSGQE